MSFPDLVAQAFDENNKYAALARLCHPCSLSFRAVLYLRSMGVNFRKDVANLEATFPALAADFSLPELMPKEVWGPTSTGVPARLIGSC